jgi:flagellar protein FliO/FliZ
MNRRLLSVPLALLALPAWAAPGSATVAAATPAPAAAGSLLQVLLGLIVVLGLLALCAWILRRFSAAKGNSGTTIRVVGGVSLGTRERVLVIEVADQWIVVGVAPGRINALSTMPKQDAPLPSGDTAQPPRNFSNWLAQSLDKRNAK